jgi:polysaccharide biosynthesis transport protein
MDTTAPSMGQYDADLPPAAPQFDIGDAIAILKRRLWHIIIPFVLLAPVGVAVAALLPAVWRSEAIVLIEQPDIPPDLVRPTVTSVVDQRIQVIQQRVSASDVLIGIIDKFDLYRDARRTQPISVVVDTMREAISVGFISVNVAGQRGKATIAFSIGFEYSDPRTAQQVTNEFVSLFLSENVRTRQRQAEQAASFLAKETAALERQISELETKIGELRREHDGSLPEQRDYNVQKISRATEALREIENRVTRLDETKRLLGAQLAETNPFLEGALSPRDRLKSLRSDLISLSRAYTDQHPDVVRLKREVRALEQELKQSAGDETAAGAEVRPVEAAAGGDLKPDNSEYLQLQSQIESINFELAFLEQQRELHLSEIAEAQENLRRTPAVELEYHSLVRALDGANQDYRSVKSRQLTAQLGESLEEDRRAERFSVIEPPSIPAKPAKPNRPLILGAGLVLALGAGFGIALLAELMDGAIYSPKRLAALTGAEPLVCVPFIRTKAERRRKLLRLGAAVLIVIVAAGAAVAYVHLRVAPLDVFWLKMERRLSDKIDTVLP